MGDQVAAVIAAHLNDDSMRLLPGVTIENGVVTKLDLSECLNCCSEQCRHPAVTNVTNYVTDVAPYPLSNRSLLSWFSGGNSISDAGASALAAGLKDSRLEALSLSECLKCCSERALLRRRHPAVTNVTNYVTDVAPYPLEPFTFLVIFRRQSNFGRRGERVGGGPEGLVADASGSG